MLEKRALVVDDDVSIRLMLTRILEKSHFQVDVARDGGEAIEKLQANLDQMLDPTDNEITWEDVAYHAHVAEAARGLVERIGE